MSCFIEEFRLVSDMEGRLVAGQLTLEYIVLDSAFGCNFFRPDTS